MAYKFISKKILDSNQLDLTNVFPEKQEIVRQDSNVTYNLLDIVMFLKDRTNNFTRVEREYVDLDNAVAEIIDKYYKSIDQKNPFVETLDEMDDDDFKSGNVPREAFVVEDGKVKGKGLAKPAPTKTGKKEEASKFSKEQLAKLEAFKKELDNRREIFFDVYDDAEQADFLSLMENKLEAEEVIAEDDEYFMERVAILKEFINQLKNK